MLGLHFLEGLRGGAGQAMRGERLEGLAELACFHSTLGPSGISGTGVSCTGRRASTLHGGEMVGPGHEIRP